MLQKGYKQNTLDTPFYFHDLHPKKEDLQKEVLLGLQSFPKFLSPKFFYNHEGSDLFNQITLLPEYYLTRTEIGILNNSLDEITSCLGKECTLIEYGCGSSGKIKILLDALIQAHTYMPIDISRQHLLDLSQSLANFYPQIEVLALCADFTHHLDLPLDSNPRGKRVVFFPGSSIGNFEPKDAQSFLQNIGKTLGRGGGLLIGVDLKKDKKILHAAYNDANGITARFNLNLLKRINRECEANFKIEQFNHSAFYNEDQGRIEMHLVSRLKQTIEIQGPPIPFAEGESIHTENSYKYSIEEFQHLASISGWKPLQVWTDPNHWFSVHYLEIAI